MFTQTMFSRRRVCVCIYIYIYRERERQIYIYIYRERERFSYIYIYTYTSIHTSIHPSIHPYIHTYIHISEEMEQMNSPAHFVRSTVSRLPCSISAKQKAASSNSSSSSSSSSSSNSSSSSSSSSSNSIVIAINIIVVFHRLPDGVRHNLPSQKSHKSPTCRHMWFYVRSRCQMLRHLCDDPVCPDPVWKLSSCFLQTVYHNGGSLTRERVLDFMISVVASPTKPDYAIIRRDTYCSP